jgi:hypothetical protein
MSFRLIKQIGVILATTTADDAAHATSSFTISSKSSIRITEVAGQDAYVKVSNEGTAVTNSSGVSNGFCLKANSSVTIVPDEKVQAIAVLSATVANPAVLTIDTPGHGLIAGQQVSLVGAAVAAWNTLITDSNIASVTSTTITTDKNSASTAAYTGGGTLMTCFKVSAINETAGSDAGLVIEEVIVGNVGI